MATAAVAPLSSAEGRTIHGEVPWAPGEADSPIPVSQTESYVYFTPEEAAFIESAVARRIPANEPGPGAREVGCPLFIDRQLAGAYQSRMTPAQVYRAAITPIDAHCRSTFEKKSFAQLGPDDQDKVLGELEAGKITLDSVDESAFFKQLLLNTQEGFFADPLYGGNKDMAAWKMIGFPGARYDYRDYVGKHGERFPLPPVSLKGRPAWHSKS